MMEPARVRQAWLPKTRGGAFHNNDRNLRSAVRNRNEPDNRNNNLGFRCLRDVERGVRTWRLDMPEPAWSRATQGARFHFRAAMPDVGLNSCVEYQRTPVAW